MNTGKIGFFRRMYLAITDFRVYPYIQKEKLRTAIGYFLKLVLLVAFISGIVFTYRIWQEIPEWRILLETNLPEFSITNGTLKTAESVEKPLNSDWFLIVNPEISYNTLQDFTFVEEEEHTFYLLVLSDGVTLAVRTSEGIYDMGGMIFEDSLNLTKSEFLTIMKETEHSVVAAIVVTIFTTIGIFLGSCLVRFWMLLMYIVSIFILNFFFGLRLRWKDYFKVAIYISTLPFILETIATLVVGSVSETISFISMLASCVYIFYALRALRLEAMFSVGSSGGTTEERVKSALAHAQEELEKQLKELEKEQEKQEAQKKEETQEKQEEPNTSEEKEEQQGKQETEKPEDK